ncbi:LON peptidase substrate-binding domain-containing protein [Kozakia baliensis]|uniref:LON peptidase substrate-binding domain-containing protein n=1 Tax=Kozakia baliensis TaxID=153496 RepID=UPI0004951525|nr:LON peptidase substrate-binding domain-containing protein [Kozakia baliensis]
MSSSQPSHLHMDDDIPRRIPRPQDMTLADIPPRLGLFPLPGALLLPWGKLPLNVFEPRYIALVEDALATHRLIGVIQPRDEYDEADEPDLHNIGSLGRITSFTERADGSYAITLSGLTRFRVLREQLGPRGYREASIDASGFSADLTESEPTSIDRSRLLDSLKRYFDAHKLHTSWSVIEEMENDTLMIVLPMLVPFSADEKQSLLEADTLCARAELLLSLLNDTPDDISDAEDE